MIVAGTIATAAGQSGTAAKLRRLLAQLPPGEVTLGDVIDAFSTAGIGLSLLLFSLLTLIPGIAPLFGVALCALAIGMVLGQSSPVMPRRLRGRHIDRDRLVDGIRRLNRPIAWMERLLRPRLPYLSQGTGMRLCGFASLLNGILIVLPIPFGNTAPAVAMLILSIGLVVGDGVAILLGLLATIVGLMIDIGMIAMGYSAFTALFTHFF